VRKAPADVLLVREHMTKPFQKVLACVDFSETSARAVCYARKIAEHEHAQLDCLYVFQSALALSWNYGGYLPASSLRPETEALENWQKRLDDFAGVLLQDAKDISWRALVEERPCVRESIYDFVRTAGVDLVVLGTRGRTDLRSIIMGSTAEKIISHSPCSVLAIKPKGFDYAIQ
jgi:nucleotide-binding universal stress UspA family protein